MGQRNKSDSVIFDKKHDMGNNFAKHEKDYIAEYQQKGYDVDFRIEDEKLVASDSKNTYRPKEISIVAEHRYEGMSNPSDLSILYVIETDKGEKGTFLMGYGPNASMEANEFFKEVPDENFSDKANIDG